MTHVSIPPWNATGLIPPVIGDAVGHFRSPYNVSIVDVVCRFGTSTERRTILKGFLMLRGVLQQFGIVEGFQWLNGSFMENQEILQLRPPKDIDVVTFCREEQATLNESNSNQVLNHQEIKANFLVDHYFVDLGLPDRELVYWTVYWSSIWSHRRTMQWKGFLQVELDSSGDLEAAKILAEMETEGDSK